MILRKETFENISLKDIVMLPRERSLKETLYRERNYIIKREILMIVSLRIVQQLFCHVGYLRGIVTCYNIFGRYHSEINIKFSEFRCTFIWLKVKLNLTLRWKFNNARFKLPAAECIISQSMYVLQEMGRRFQKAYNGIFYLTMFLNNVLLFWEKHCNVALVWGIHYLFLINMCCECKCF